MSKVQMFRSLVKQRLAAAEEDIFVLFERTILEYEQELSRSKEENERQRHLLDAFKPQVRLHRADFTADVQQLLVVKEEVPPEQQEWNPSLDDANPPESPRIKEEPWTSQDGELLQGLEEADVKFMFTPVLLNKEDDDEEPHSSQRQMKAEADERDCGGPEPARNSDPDRHLPDTEGNEVSHDYCADAGESCESGKHVEAPVSDAECKTGNKRFICSECGETFDSKANLKLHIRVHTGDEAFRCSVCGSGFSQKENLINHMIHHTADEPFSCSVCKKSFRYGGNLLRHMERHTNLFSCSFCGKSFTQSKRLASHMSIHTEDDRLSRTPGDRRFIPGQELKRIKPHECVGESSQFHQSQSIARDPTSSSTESHGEPEPAGNSDGKTEDFSEIKIEISDADWDKTTYPQSGSNAQMNNGVAVGDKMSVHPFSCSECGKIFRRKDCLQIHKRIHTGEKPLSCSVCGKRFSQRNTFIEHTRRHTGQGMLNCSVCGKKFAFNFQLRNHMRTHTGEKPFSCSVCSKGFSYKRQLIQHMNVHLSQH